jgi:hypothetical protein
MTYDVPSCSTSESPFSVVRYFYAGAMRLCGHEASSTDSQSIKNTHKMATVTGLLLLKDGDPIRKFECDHGQTI